MPNTHIWPCGNTSHNPVRKAQHSIHLTMRGTNLVIYVRRAQHLHSTMWGTNPTYMSKGLCTYIWPCEEPIQHVRKGFALTFDHARNQSSMSEGLYTYIWPCEEPIQHVRRALHLHLIMWEHIPQSHQNGSTLTSDHVGSNPIVTS